MCEKTRIMFDSNIFDKLGDNIHLLAKRDDIDFCVTSLQIEEILSIPDKKRDVRLSTGMALCELRPKIVPTPFTFDYINFRHFTFASEPNYWKLLKESRSNRNDALIAATAIRENCFLITDDTNLLKRMKKISAMAMTYSEFYSKFLQPNQ